jgi:hypothetical protein
MIEELYSNEWVSLRRIVEPSLGINGYVYSHETRCSGKIVVVLPYRIMSDVNANVNIDDIVAGDSLHIEFLLRDEITPCWSVDVSQLSAITGSWEDTDDPLCRSAAVRELWEESGYLIADSEMISLGKSFASKSSDTVYYLYTVNLHGLKPTGDGRGDGSELEARASCRWMREDELFDLLDPQVHLAHNRLMHRLT